MQVSPYTYSRGSWGASPRPRQNTGFVSEKTTAQVLFGNYYLTQGEVMLHAQALRAHSRVVTVVNSVLPLYKQLAHQNRTGFLIVDPRNPSRLLVITAFHGVSPPQPGEDQVIDGALCHNRSDAWMDGEQRMAFHGSGCFRH